MRGTLAMIDILGGKVTLLLRARLQTTWFLSLRAQRSNLIPQKQRLLRRLPLLAMTPPLGLQTASKPGCKTFVHFTM